jgi:ADP-heptose:LPS heptosyltransferase
MVSDGRGAPGGGGSRLGDSLGRIGVVRALPGLGDLLCGVPALRALRHAHPESSIVLVGLPSSRPFVERFAVYVDELVEFPGYPGIPERPYDAERFRSFLGDVVSRPFDAAVQMHGSGIVTNAFTAFLSAPVTAGFYLPGQFLPDPARFLPLPAHEPEVRRNVLLMEFLGIPSTDDDLEFPVTPADEEALAHIPEAASLAPGSYACVHPGATLRSRRWAPEGFAAVADRLVRAGFDVVLTGTSGERDLVRATRELMRSRAIDLAGRTTVGALAALLRGARLLVCNDTGVSHLAAALGVPSVVVFTRSDPERWAPLDAARHRRVLQSSAETNPCQHVLPPDAHRCLRDGCTAALRVIDRSVPPVVTAGMVWTEAEDLLAGEPA